MAKIAFVFVLSLVLFLSFHSVLGAESPAESFVKDMDKAASDAKGAMASMTNSAGDAMAGAKETSVSWAEWFKSKLRNMGILSGNSQSARRAGPAPVPAPVPAPAA